MLSLQRLQSLASIQQQNTSMPPSLVGLATDLSAAKCLNSPLNLSLGSTSNSHKDPVNSIIDCSSTAAVVAALSSNINNVADSGTCSSQMPQLILASGQLMQGVQGAQLLIPTSKGKFGLRY